MIGAVFAWLRRRPVKQPPEQRVHWTAIGVGGSNTSVESINDDWSRQVFKQLASGRLFEIRY
jgi:hypothetical protein